MTILPLLCVEGVLRIFWSPPPESMGAELRGTALFVPDAKLGWRMAPDFRLDFRWSWWETATIRTNSLGFRDVEPARDRSAGVPRVVVLGDSHAFGFGVEAEDMFTSVLRPLLPGIEILNLAVTGYNLRQSRVMFQEQGAALLPDVVVLAFTQNDVTQQVIPSTAAVTARAAPESGFIRHSYVLQFLRERVNSNRTLVRLCISLGIKEELGGFEMLDSNLRQALRDYPPELRRDWEETCAELRLLRDACSSAGATLLVVSVPALQTVDPARLERSLAYLDYTPEDFDLEKPYRVLGESCAADGIAFLDAHPAFVERQRNGEPPHLERDLHINASGHRIIAEALTPRLKEMLKAK
jgi:lysophospholipase L1-like esterase